MAGAVLVGVAALATWWSVLTGDGLGGLPAGAVLAGVAVVCWAAGRVLVGDGPAVRVPRPALRGPGRRP
jgi:hypothetical protein